jgi:hypothetical protein
MLFKKTKTEPNLIEFRKACLVINSCKTYAQLKIAINYANLYYAKNKDFTTHQHLMKLVSKKLQETKLVKV